MRRSDREITDLDNIVEIMKKCDVCRVAFFDDDYPYIVPLNFGLSYQDSKITLYFHGAREGKKLDLLRKNNKVCFEMDCSHQLVTGDLACEYSMNYESVIGFGCLTVLENTEKRMALDAMMQQYTKNMNFTYDERALNAVTVFKLTVDQVTGKHRI